MCREVKCTTCSKSSWVGCGLHLDTVFANIVVDKRCYCGFDSKELTALLAKNEKPGPYPKGAN
jgi:hypothetical protein